MIDTIKNRRTIRSFKQDELSKEDIYDILECARLAPTGANLQSLKYVVITDKKTREKMFPYIKYAGYLPDWNPTFNECPPVFIAVVNDSSIKQNDKCEVDCGAAIMSMCLGAEDKGISSCWLGAIVRDKIKSIIDLGEKYYIAYLVGFGYANQKANAVPVTEGIKYYFENDTLCVPKRPIEEILIHYK